MVCELLKLCGGGGAFEYEALLFRGLWVCVWCGIARVVRRGWQGFGGGFEDHGAFCSFDVVVGVGMWDGVWVDPTFGFGFVELEA